jgi:cell division protein FtsW
VAEPAPAGRTAWHLPSVRLTVLFFALVCVGLVVSASSAGRGQFRVVLVKRLLTTAFGAAAFVAGVSVPYRFWRRHQLGALLASLAVLVAVFVPGLGIAKNGARRWIAVGLPFGCQPSEFAKVGLCIWVAAYCERNLAFMRRFVRGLLAPLVVVGLACGLLLAEPDFGTAVLTGLTCTAVLLVMGARVIYFGLLAVASIPLAHQLVFGVPYRLRRVTAFLDPWNDAQGAGYQLVQSLIAVGSGGLTGLGLGAGRQKADFLPGATNDFVFSVAAEEVGFLGSVALILLIALLLWELLRVVQRSPDPFAFALSLGFTLLLGVQAAAHIAVATGCIPTKGLSLPFISAGGSSLVASLFAAGVLVNIAASAEGSVPARPSAREEPPGYERAAQWVWHRTGKRWVQQCPLFRTKGGGH